MYSILAVIFLKIFVYFLYANYFFSLSIGGGNDSDYYHSYAIGLSGDAVNFWPVILRYLNDFGLYDRSVLSVFLFFCNVVLIPLFFFKSIGLRFSVSKKNYLYAFLLVESYVVLFYYSFDIYRDVFMVFVFVVGVGFVRGFIFRKNVLVGFFVFLLVLFISYFLFLLRPYLGVSFVVSFFVSRFILVNKNKKSFFILYFFSLLILNYLGCFDSLKLYRSGFDESVGSTLGIDFNDPVMFIPNFIKSTLSQLMGLYFFNYDAFFLFLFETTPFLFALFFVFRNLRYSDRFVTFLLVFFIIYSSIWVIGNDNLGTAVRLRIFSYFSIYMAAFYLKMIKDAREGSI